MLAMRVLSNVASFRGLRSLNYKKKTFYRELPHSFSTKLNSAVHDSIIDYVFIVYKFSTVALAGTQ